MTPYKTGTIAITQGSPNVIGTGTSWLANVRPGDLITIDYAHWYPVSTVVDNTNLVLDINYPDATITAQAYSVSRISSNWGMNSTIQSQLVELLDDFHSRIDDNYKGIKGDKGDVALTVRGLYAATTTYVPGDIVSSGSGIYLCVLQATGQDPTTANSAYWTQLVFNTYNITEGDPA